MVAFLAWFGFVGFGGCFVGSFLLCFCLFVVLIAFVLVLVWMRLLCLLGFFWSVVCCFSVWMILRGCSFVVVLYVYCYACGFCSLR